MDKVEVGSAIKAHRLKREIALRQVARDIDTYPANICRYESGRVMPQINILWKLADYYGITLDELVGR